MLEKCFKRVVLEDSFRETRFMYLFMGVLQSVFFIPSVVAQEDIHLW